MSKDFNQVIDRIDRTMNLCHLIVGWLYGCVTGMLAIYMVMS